MCLKHRSGRRPATALQPPSKRPAERGRHDECLPSAASDPLIPPQAAKYTVWLFWCLRGRVVQLQRPVLMFDLCRDSVRAWGVQVLLGVSDMRVTR